MLRGGSAGRLRIDLIAECIWRDGERASVRPKAFLVLRYLMERPEQLVTKAELLDAVWPDTFVIDTILNVAVNELREALGDDPKQPRFIATVHRRGFRWVGPTADAAAPPAEDSSTFVGRADSLAELERCYSRAAAGQRQLVFVTGEPGIGKTALVERFITGLGATVAAVRAPASPNAATPYLLGRGQCVDRYGAGETYRPLLDAAEDLLRTGGEPMRGVFRKHAPSWLLQMHDVLADDEIEKLLRRVKTPTIEWMQREFERAIEAASADRTVILVIEDLHWSDPATVSVLGALATRGTPARLFILATYRSFDAVASQHPVIHLKHELAAKRQCVELALDGLPGESVEAYIDQRFGSHRLPQALAARLHVQTSGNPLFLLNALAHFEQSGWLYEHDGVWECGTDVDTLAGVIPDGTRDLIAFRLDLLPPPTQELLEAASLAGMTFSTQAIAAATERTDTDLESECQRLSQTPFLQQGAEVIWPDGSRGRQQKFRHSLYRQVLEGRISPSRRALLHRRIAERMERGYGGRAAEIAGTLRYHYEQSGDVLRAVDCIEMMVQQAFARRAMEQAMLLHDDAVRLLEQLPDSEVAQRRLRQMTIGLGFLSTTTFGSGDARTSHAIAAVENLGAASLISPEHLASLGLVAGGHLAAGEYQRTRRVGEELLTLAGNAPAVILLAGHSFAGIASFYLGDITAALAHLEHTATMAPSVPPTCVGDGPLVSVYDIAVPALGVRAQALTLAGRAGQGAASIEAALARARTIDMPWYLGWALSGACSTGVLRRDCGKVRQRANELQAHCGDGQEHLKAVASFMLSWATLMESGNADLIGPLREALDEVLSIPDPMVASRYLSMLADAHLRLGQPDGAAAALDRAEAERGENRFYDAQLHRQRAALALLGVGRKRTRTKAVEGVETMLETAVDIARAQGSHLLALRASVDLARRYVASKRRRDARERLMQALAPFDEDCDDVDPREARELIATL